MLALHDEYVASLYISTFLADCEATFRREIPALECYKNTDTQSSETPQEVIHNEGEIAFSFHWKR